MSSTRPSRAFRAHSASAKSCRASRIASASPAARISSAISGAVIRPTSEHRLRRDLLDRLRVAALPAGLVGHRCVDVGVVHTRGEVHVVDVRSCLEIADDLLHVLHLEVAGPERGRVDPVADERLARRSPSLIRWSASSGKRSRFSSSRPSRRVGGCRAATGTATAGSRATCGTRSRRGRPRSPAERHRVGRPGSPRSRAPRAPSASARSGTRPAAPGSARPCTTEHRRRRRGPSSGLASRAARRAGAGPRACSRAAERPSRPSRALRPARRSRVRGS